MTKLNLKLINYGRNSMVTKRTPRTRQTSARNTATAAKPTEEKTVTTTTVEETATAPEPKSNAAVKPAAKTAPKADAKTAPTAEPKKEEEPRRIFSSRRVWPD
jgi:hypothetical protein